MVTMSIRTPSRQCLRTINSSICVHSQASHPFHQPGTHRSLSSSTTRCSNIGSAPLTIPRSVDFSIIPVPPAKSGVRSIGSERPSPIVVIKGPLGEINMPIQDFIAIDHDKSMGKAIVRVANSKERQQRAMWGTTRALLNNHILGVSEGHTTLLRMVGVGYRATIEKTATTVQPEYPGQEFVSLKVGYSHPIELGIPRHVKASTPQPTRILLEGHEKQVIKNFAARIRKWRVPEPYKGKGIFVDDETIKIKAKKIK